MLKKVFVLRAFVVSVGLMGDGHTATQQQQEMSEICNNDNDMYLACVDSKPMLNFPCNDTNLIERQNNKNLSKKKGDSVIMDLLENFPQDEYGLNPHSTMFLGHVSLKKSDFDNMFRSLDDSIRQNIAFCSSQVWNKLKKWLGNKAQAALADAESAFVEFEGCSEKDIKTIEDYFWYANERILDLICYVNSQKPVS